MLVPQSDGGILARLECGAGATLDQQSTLAATGTEQTDAIDELAGNLVSRTGYEVGNPASVFDGDLDGLIAAGIRWRKRKDDD